MSNTNTIFILTYCEGDWFVQNAWENVDHSKYNFIVLDNGNQKVVQDYCESKGWEYYAAEYNIGSTGGYNWIFRAASLLKLQRAALVQADVEIIDIKTIDYLFDIDTYKKNDEGTDDTSILMWPQNEPSNWHDDEPDPADRGRYVSYPYWKGAPVNLGQIFSFNPDHLIYNNFLNDENFVVTHFDDIDLKQRLVDNRTRVLNLAWFHKLQPLWRNFRNMEGQGSIDGMYDIMHISSLGEGSSNHEEWYEYNIDYYNEKVKMNNLNKFPQASLRWTALGYPPFPVEYELNRWWSLRGSKL